jgi:hypothetical protein
VRALADALGVEPRSLATPNEVAELRRLKRGPEPTDGTGNGLDSWADDGGTAEPEADGRDAGDSIPRLAVQE